MEMHDNQDTRPMSVGEWFVTLLILALPVVNIVMYLVWAFSSVGNLNRRNYCRAVLLWLLVGLGLMLVFMLVMGGLAVLTGGHR
jgi:hypothetical protein